MVNTIEREECLHLLACVMDALKDVYDITKDKEDEKMLSALNYSYQTLGGIRRYFEMKQTIENKEVDDFISKLKIIEVDAHDNIIERKAINK